MAKHDADRKVREEEERVILEARKIEQLERDKFRQLLRDANRWHQARILRNFIQAIELRDSEMNNTTEIIHEWITWAKSKVESFDPLVNIESGSARENS
jgi:chromosome condensin MukBEF ATPase and DNA-binding subunit MukB